MKKAGDLLKNIFDNFNIKEPRGGKSIISSWQDIAGQELSEHTRITDIRKDTLYLEADHPGWLQILELKKRSVLGSINTMFPEKGITDIRISLKKKRK
jgi:predicted nucleic acid-binding Zn ribbon protein